MPPADRLRSGSMSLEPGREPRQPRMRASSADRALGARQAFYRHLASYLSVNAMLVGIWAFSGRGYFWPIWPIMGWGVAVVGQAVRALGPGADRPERDDRR